MPVRTEGTTSKPLAPVDSLSTEEQAVIAAIRETQFGSVEVILHQARIAQIVRSERQRFDGGPAR